jgi:hypothetical protein
MTIFETVLKAFEEKASYEFENDDYSISVDYEDEFDEVVISIDYNGEWGAGVNISRKNTEKEISGAIEEFFPNLKDKDFNFKK